MPDADGVPEHARIRGALRLVFRLAGAFVAGLIVLLIAGALWQAWASRRDATQFPPPGRMVDAGGHRLFLSCAGAGGPTVVFDSGLGETHASWIKVYPEVRKFARACVYDRAGMGWSEAGPLPRDSEHIVAELHALLAKAGERGPFLLVAHSIAGCHARVYAQRFRPDVAGLVLVDPTPASVFGDPPPNVAPVLKAAAKMSSALASLGEALAFTGVMRAVGAWHGEQGPLPRQFRAMRDEQQAVELDARQALAIHALGDVPLAVIEARKAMSVSDFPPLVSVFLPRGYDLAGGLRAMETAARADHAAQAALSTRGRMVAAERSGHFVQNDRPELVIATIREMLAPR